MLVYKNLFTNLPLQLPLRRASWMKLLICTERWRARVDALKTCSGISLERRYLHSPTFDVSSKNKQTNVISFFLQFWCFSQDAACFLWADTQGLTILGDQLCRIITTLLIKVVTPDILYYIAFWPWRDEEHQRTWPTLFPLSYSGFVGKEHSPKVKALRFLVGMMRTAG